MLESIQKGGKEWLTSVTMIETQNPNEKIRTELKSKDSQSLKVLKLGRIW